jgi:cytochrome oxidase Cu insertion factor (SCO1/SenC/PrrC family)
MTEPGPSDTARHTSRAQFWLLAALFLVPLGFATFMYATGWRPEGTVNKGDLIHPARPLTENTFVDPQDQTITEDLLKGKWTLVYIGNGQCDARCREALTLMRQTRLALGKEAPRVRGVFFATADCCDMSYLSREHAGLLVARAEEASDREWLAQFPEYSGVPVDQAGRIYIVDPLGNLMMSYAPDAPDKALLEDLKRLLKQSHIG